jgi:hypothetical protein
LETALGAKAASGANSDITSLTGLTTPLTVAQGGTGQGSTSIGANEFFASPDGVAGGPVFRAIVAGDIPTLNQNTTGSAASLTTGRTIQTNLASTTATSFNGTANITPGVTGTLPVNHGGTGATTLTGILKGNGTSAVTAVTAPTGAIVGTTDTQTLSGKTLTSPVINTGTVGADPTVALGVASKQYVDGFGTTTLTENETPGGSINGSNTAFTTASTFASGSLRVYLNGQRLTAGSGNDYVEATQGFTMQYAPATGDVLLVDYNVTNSHFIQGSNSSIVNETPTGTVNGTTTLFTVLQGKYVANTLQVYINGLQQTKTTDFTETSPGSGTFTFTTAPVTGDVVRVAYQFSTGASGNADTVDGFHASSTPTASTLLPLDSNALVPSSALRLSAATTNSVATAETITSTTYGDMTTVGPAVTVTIGSSGMALVTVGVIKMFNNTSGSETYMSFAASGANTIAASDTKAIMVAASSGSLPQIGVSKTVLLTGLSPGSTTFTAKYRVSANTGGGQNRDIMVMPL